MYLMKKAAVAKSRLVWKASLSPHPSTLKPIRRQDSEYALRLETPYMYSSLMHFELYCLVFELEVV